MSDPVWKIESWRWFSYLASSAEIASALLLALVGLAVVRVRGVASFGAVARDDADLVRPN